MKYPNELRYYGAAEEIAKMCGVSRQTVYNWKRNDEVPLRVEKQIRKMVKQHRVLSKPAAQPEPQPETLKLKLSDIAQMIVDYLKQEGL